MVADEWGPDGVKGEAMVAQKVVQGSGMDSMPYQQSINWVSLIVGCRMVKSDGRGVFWEYAD